MSASKYRRAAASVQLLGILAALPAVAMAQHSPSASARTDVTIIYDATLHEFVCWGEGRPTEPDMRGRVETAIKAYSANPRTCDGAPPSSRFYPYKDNIYFFDNQQVWIKLVGAHIGDLFTVQATGAAVTEPTIPIFGAVTTLPTFASLLAAAAPSAAPGAAAPGAGAAGGAAGAGAAGGAGYLGYGLTEPGKGGGGLPQPAPKTPAQPPQPSVFLYVGDELFADLDSSDSAALATDLQQLALAFNQPAVAGTGSGATAPSAPPIKTTTTSQGSTTTTTTTIGATDSSSTHAGGHAMPGQLPVQILSPTLANAISYFNGADGVVNALDDQVRRLREGLRTLHFATSCQEQPPSPNPLTLLGDVTKLQRVVDSENALYQELVAGQYQPAAQSLSTAAALLGSAVLPASVTAQVQSFAKFQDAVDGLRSVNGGIQAAVTHIVRVHTGTQTWAYAADNHDQRLTDVLDQVNRWHYTGDVNIDNLKVHLTYLFSQLGNIDAIGKAFDGLRATVDDLQSDGAKGASSALSRSIALQNELNDLGEKTIAAALVANCSVENTLLPDPYDFFSAGSWNSSQTVPLSLQQTTRVPLFNLSTVNANAVNGASPSQAAPVAQPGTAAGPGAGGTPTLSASASSASGGGGTTAPGSAGSSGGGGTGAQGSSGSGSGGQAPNSSASSPTGAAPAPSVVRQTTFNIHARYHWRLGAGVVYGRVPHDGYTILTSQTPPSAQAGPSCASTSTCLYVIESKARQQVLPTLDLVYLFTPQDPFPRSFRGVDESEPRVAWGTMVGFDLAAPGNNFLVGLAAMFRAGHGSVLNGLGVKVALSIGKESQVSLPSGVTVNTFFNPPNPNTVAVTQVWRPGLVVGATISAGAFESFIGSIFN